MWRKLVKDSTAITPEERERLRGVHKKDCLLFSVTFISITILSLLFNELFANPDVNLTVFYILGIVVVARYTSGYIWGVLFSVLSVVSINYFFTYPYHNFNMTLEGYPITFVSMLVIYIITSAMTTAMKEQSMVLAKQEKELMEAQKEKMRANLLRAVSHDLRTPLTGIIGNSESYLIMEEELTKEEKYTIIENIKSDANWLLNMVENLLSVTRIDNDTTKVKKYLEPVDEVVSSAVVRFKKRFPEAAIKVKLPDELIMVMMDATLIEQLLINILQNAQVHSKTVKPIELTVEQADSKVWFYVRDYGIGIAEDRLETLFDGEGYNEEKDVKADGYKGMGIGLSICKTIVVAHGGDIKVKNHQDGSEFYFYLPEEREE